MSEVKNNFVCFPCSDASQKEKQLNSPLMNWMPQSYHFNHSSVWEPGIGRDLRDCPRPQSASIPRHCPVPALLLPWLLSLSEQGEEGLQEVLRILQDEFRLSMALAGKRFAGWLELAVQRFLHASHGKSEVWWMGHEKGIHVSCAGSSFYI